jgi:hypothetical protein
MVGRGKKGSGLGAIGVGEIAIIAEYEKLVKRENKGDAKFRYDFQADIVFINITGKAVFEDLKTIEGKWKIEFVRSHGNFLTILSDLSVSEIYFKIKNFYYDILDNCLEKTASEQQDYVFRFNKPISMIPWSSGHIEKSKEYIRNLPESSIDANLEDLVMQIIRGILEYAYHAKDESGVKMYQYANALMKKL